MGGQTLAESVAKNSRVQAVWAGWCYVGGQAWGAGFFAENHHGCLANISERQESGLDLSRFYAQASDLDLLVCSAEKIQRAIRAPLCQVSSAIHAFRGRAIRARNKAFRCCGRTS